MLFPVVKSRPRRLSFFVGLAGALLVAPRASAALGEGSRGIVSSTHPLATQAGLDVLKSGGNAVDAAVAVGLTLGVVDGHNSGIGGGGFMVLRRASGEIVVLDGRETAPAAATRAMYQRNGKGEVSLSQTGALASGVPGLLALYQEAIANYGRKPLAELARPAAKIAEDGFPIDFVYARKLKSNAATLRKFDETRVLFFKAGGEPLVQGDLLRQPDLARSYRAIAERGVDWFYRGDYAARVDAWMKHNGGILTADDFARYTVRRRTPVVSTYRGYTIVGVPPPSSGGVHVAQILNILENFDLAGAKDEATRLNLIAEAMKLAFADRAYWLGDPAYVDVPRGLLDKGYAKQLAARVDPSRATRVASQGTPPEADPRFFEKHTTHFSVADAEGNWVACTQTVNTAFGSKVIVPGTGILLNNEMDDFSIDPGVPNHFKLVGAEANAIAPGKRPLSCMSPTLVLKDGQPIYALGGAGGPTIISQAVLNLIALLDLRQPLDAALAQPRIHQQWVPDELRVERAMPEAIRTELAKRGHKLDLQTEYGVSHAVGRSADGKGFIGAADPRAGGLAAGW
jgi:gamma-glutamyltranspeptidase/glutathione hydrolase